MLQVITIVVALQHPNPFDKHASKEAPYVSHAADGIKWCVRRIALQQLNSQACAVVLSIHARVLL